MTGAPAELDALLACPACPPVEAPPAEVMLSADGNELVCGDCGTRFPVYTSGPARIPWLFARPDGALNEWKARFNGFLNANAAEQLRLQNAVAGRHIGATGRKRMQRLIDARRAQREQITDLLAPLPLEAAPAGSLSGKLPKSQGLTNYYANVFRDWAWHDGENAQLVRSIASVTRSGAIERLGTTLTIGAGACRLAYDLHRASQQDLAVALDINPLLLFLAARVIHGEELRLHEFPVAPLNDASFAALQTCRAPAPLDPNTRDRFRFVCADGLNPPFVPGRFDTVVTPWLIDILPQDLRKFVPHVNRLLKSGGTWLNTGSLAFFHRDEAWCYSQEEVLELLEDNGFEVVAATRTDTPYLQSPLSANKRVESVFSFNATKVGDVAVPPRFEYLPEWMRDSSKPVPDLDEFILASSDHLLQTQALTAIDGKRTIEEIGRLVAEHYNLQVGEATHAVRRILVDVYEGEVI